ncbi:hypothetical protein PSA7680_03013 [Pseudoruegeria aquimaris]|uniref:Uncharacterized protein n=1 Tax=Pseudoruegeria aquimaris TaxID=393663 RepID=A0A1Y5T7H3_9RHOB|nr:hypothetical protein [Pseudoruegeria aquimaris]SLN57522.1 hypothetical protein PSA7680_03013 [Pseudoruegeria aquimaris]
MESKAEYEDVLSSIRRLVSEEVRSRAPLAEVKAEAVRGESPATRVLRPAEKLVLTPAQRIRPEAADPKPAAGSADGPLLLHPNTAVSEPEPEQLAERAEEDPFASFEEVFGKDEWQRAPLADSRLASLERTIAELESVVSDQGHVFEPDGSEELGSSPEIEPLTAVPRRPAAAADECEEPQAEAGEEFDGSLPSFLRHPQGGEAAPEEDTQADEAQHGEAVQSEAEAPETQEWARPSETDPRPEPRFEPEAEVQPEFRPEPRVEPRPEPQPEPVVAPFAEEEDAVLLDEEALRQMVRDLVREELQGVLGERITRNVRKLVRTEIHRIIASQDFD